MTSEQETGRSGLGREQAAWVAPARLAVGLIQGLMLWALYHFGDGGRGHAIWPATDSYLFGPMILVACATPIVLLAGLGRLRLKTLVVWGLVVAVTVALLACHDVARASTAKDGLGSFIVVPFTAAALFIAHHLIVPADRERRWIAPYHDYFDAAWLAGVQLVLSIGFTAAFWLLLGLGAALFHIIGLGVVGDVITKPGFALPVTGLVFATAVQLTDVRDGLIRGVRSVALMLLSWLLLLLTVLVAAFLAALPFTGLKGLWETGNATALVLSATGALVILINAAYQDGTEDTRPPRVLQFAVRVAAVLLTPLILIAVWGLALRIGQHGLTPDRIIASACALVGAAYAVGYGMGAVIPLLRRGSPWMKALEITNIVVAVLTVLVILALFSPIADPARLSVADQVRRLESGKVAPDAFDYAFLRFQSGRVGQQALERLATSQEAAIATRAQNSKANARPDDLADAHQPPVPRLVIDPADGSAALPAAFLDHGGVGNFTGCYAAGECVGTQRDLDKDTIPEILVADRLSIHLFKKRENMWVELGAYVTTACGDRGDPREALRRGKVATLPARLPDLEIDGKALSLMPNTECALTSLPH
ncbi:DUF4153 domain-containing protein [soil metagenome]